MTQITVALPERPSTPVRVPVDLLIGREQLGATDHKISVRNLNFYYEDGVRALKNVSVPIYSNRVTAFIGPSGCGKSTSDALVNDLAQ
jgi:ABC-type transport system involved in cytochrome bd biosynthesis fused ATPase/permease subunit